MRAAELITDLAAHGRYAFTTAEAGQRLGSSTVATRAALRRLRQKGEVAMPYRGFFLIVPPEYRVLGCLPPAEFVPALMARLGEPYYVGLLSAAQFYGAAHHKRTGRARPGCAAHFAAALGATSGLSARPRRGAEEERTTGGARRRPGSSGHAAGAEGVDGRSQARRPLARGCQCRCGAGRLIPKAFIDEWRHEAPWVDDLQVEQDLISRRSTA